MPHRTNSVVRLPLIAVLLTFIAGILCAAGNLHAQTLTGQENQYIALPDAARLTQSYRDSTAGTVVLGEYFAKAGLQAILSQTGCIGVRIYNARNDSGQHVFVIVGVGNAGSDLTGGLLMEHGFPCPPVCDSTSLLQH